MAAFDVETLVHPTGAEIHDAHDRIILHEGGLAGTRIPSAGNAIADRIQTALLYQSFRSAAEVAALYAEVIARGHYFNDGNKRTALAAMLVFLDYNGFTLTNADQVAIADEMVELAQGHIDYRRLAVWIEGRVQRL